MKVKIVKARDYNWYDKHIGEIFEVINETNSGECYNVKHKEGDRTDFSVSKDHCEIINPIKIPFTFSAWDKDRSQKVWTRDGREVKQLTWFDCNSIVPLVGVVEKDVMRWGVNGLWGSSASKYDLFLEHTEKEYFVNVYRNENGGIYINSDCYNTFNSAESVGKVIKNYIKTISLTA